MRHRNSGRKLGRTPEHRRALFANLANALIEHERIVTTDAKAKDLRRVAEKLVSKAKRGLQAAEAAKKAAAEAKKKGEDPKKYAAAESAVHARRTVYAYLRSAESVERLFGPLAERFKGRNGGYTRIIKAGYRAGDKAPISIVEFVDRPETPAE
ncbi:MAG: 50S ribosomal protein L17 [Deltaproteobacteria bacterium]|nr:50S ribosomal protein L17 [Deltaproteobacteria bacterium]